MSLIKATEQASSTKPPLSLWLLAGLVRVRRGALMTIGAHGAKLPAMHREVYADGESITSRMGQARGALAR